MADASDLDKLKAEPKKTQEDISGLNQKGTGLQSDIKTLETKLAEIDRATAGYDKSAADTQWELDDDERTIGKKRTISEAAVKHLKDLIDRKIADFDKALDGHGEAVKKAATLPIRRAMPTIQQQTGGPSSRSTQHSMTSRRS